MQGGAGQQKRVLEMEAADRLGDLGLFVLDDVALVEHHVAPVHAVREGGGHGRRLDHLVGGDHHVVDADLKEKGSKRQGWV